MIMIAGSSYRYLFVSMDASYYTDSLLKMDINRYLFWWLKKENYYNNIWFLNYTNNRMEIICYDQESRKRFEDRLPKSFKNIWWKSIFEEKKNEYTHSLTVDEFKTVMYALFNDNVGKFAFVLQPQVYEKIYDTTFNKNTTEHSHLGNFIIVTEQEIKDASISGCLNAFAAYDDDKKLQASDWSLTVRRERLNGIVQRFCISQLNEKNSPNPAVLRRLLDEGHADGENAQNNLSKRFVEYLLDNIDNQSDLMTFRGRKEWDEQLLNQNFWKFWELYEGRSK